VKLSNATFFPYREQTSCSGVQPEGKDPESACFWFIKGQCRKGEQCEFTHVPKDQIPALKSKTDKKGVCINFMRGQCDTPCKYGRWHVTREELDDSEEKFLAKKKEGYRSAKTRQPKAEYVSPDYDMYDEPDDDEDVHPRQSTKAQTLADTYEINFLGFDRGMGGIGEAAKKIVVTPCPWFAVYKTCRRSKCPYDHVWDAKVRAEIISKLRAGWAVLCPFKQCTYGSGDKGCPFKHPKL
jgi:hypothetical protein